MYASPSASAEHVAVAILENLRLELDLAYDTCKQCASSVLAAAYSHCPDVRLQELISAFEKDLVDAENCVDAKLTCASLQKFATYCSNHEERNWSLLENEDEITDEVERLVNLLEKSDRRVGLTAIAANDYAALKNIVQLYQMEARTNVRISLLKALKCVCLLSPKFPNILLQTILPTELVTDFLDLTKRQQFDSHRSWLTLELLVLLFSTGVSIPVHLYDVFSTDFFTKIFDCFNTGNEQLFSLVSNFLLSFNIHQRLNKETTDTANRVQSAILTRRDSSRPFVEYLLFLVNKRKDPVWMYIYEKNEYESSVIIMLQTLFDTPDTWSIFYSSDVAVLFDIVCREVVDLAPDEKIRRAYIELLLSMSERAAQNHYTDKLVEIQETIRHVLQQNDPELEGYQLDLKLIEKFKHMGFEIN